MIENKDIELHIDRETLLQEYVPKAEYEDRLKEDRRMNKEEYREEVLDQLKEQNRRLDNIEAYLFFMLVAVLVLIAVVIWQNCAVSNIENYVSNIKNTVEEVKYTDLLKDISYYLECIEEDTTYIRAYIKYK